MMRPAIRLSSSADTPREARDALVEPVERLVAEREERRGDRRHDRLQEQEEHPQQRLEPRDLGQRAHAPASTRSATSTNTSACTPKWTSPLCSAASTTIGQCVTTTTTLKRIVAGMNRARQPHGAEQPRR